MKLEVGKYYKSADGQKVGPMRYREDHDCFYWDIEKRGALAFDKDGMRRNSGFVERLVSEWPSDGPVRTVTRKEIVPGVYGRAKVGDVTGQCVRVEFTKSPTSDLMHWWDSTELRAAAATLIEIADALEDV